MPKDLEAMDLAFLSRGRGFGSKASRDEAKKEKALRKQKAMAKLAKEERSGK